MKTANRSRVTTECERVVGALIKQFEVEKKISAWIALVTLRWVWVTPEMATAMLERNFERNRKLNAKNISRMVRELLGETWYPSVATLVFTVKGWLIDGQHRLHAIIESGKPMCCLVAMNVPEDAVFGIDTNLPRNTAMVGQIAGVVVHKQACPIARRMMQSVTPSYYDPAPTAWLDYAQKYEKYTGRVADWFKGSPKGVNNVSVKAVVSRALAGRKSSKKLERFVEVLQTGLCSGKREHGIVTLRDRLTLDGGRRSGHEAYQMYSLAETILDGYLTNKPLSQLTRLKQYVAEIIPAC